MSHFACALIWKFRLDLWFLSAPLQQDRSKLVAKCTLYQNLNGVYSPPMVSSYDLFEVASLLIYSSQYRKRKDDLWFLLYQITYLVDCLGLFLATAPTNLWYRLVTRQVWLVFSWLYLCTSKFYPRCNVVVIQQSSRKATLLKCSSLPKNYKACLTIFLDSCTQATQRMNLHDPFV